MTLIEAIKSGKPFRRKGGNGAWIRPDTLSGFAQTEQGNNYYLNKYDIAEAEYEIDEPKVTVTREQVERAFAQYVGSIETSHWKRFCRALGLEG